MEREEAFRAGLRTYNTGRPCKNGHEPVRYTKTGICVGCSKMNSAKYHGKFLENKVAAALGREVTVRVPDEHVTMIQELAAGIMAQHEAAQNAALEAECYARNVSMGGQAYADRKRAEWDASRTPAAEPAPFLPRFLS